MSEYEKLQNHPIQILLKGEQGSVFVINCVEDLLPLSFKPNVIKYD
jgi:hypothetical protein